MESHNSRLSYNKCGLVYFINSVQISGCWYSDVSDTVVCVTVVTADSERPQAVVCTVRSCYGSGWVRDYDTRCAS